MVLALSALLPLYYWTSNAWSASHMPRSVVIVTLDTTRADALAAYGGTNVETPALDRLAHEGVVFEQATSPVPLTLPAHCSLFTGLFPPHHGVRDNVDPPLGDTQVTLAETLRGHGIRSAAFVGSAVVAARRGLAQGFDTYSDGQSVNPEPRLRRPANIVVNEAIDWITRQEGTAFFAWVHLYDAHAPYRLPEPYRTMYEDVPYLGAIAFMDAQVARLLKTLDQHHLAEHTIVVVVADHGESLGDHGEDSHGILLYETTIRVPLIIRAPGLSPKRVSDVVRLVDVMPTVLDALGMAGPRTDGVSLVPVMAGQMEHIDLDAYSESLYPRRFGWGELHALRAGRFKFVSASRPELYDLEKDPRERHNIYDERPELGAVMSAALKRAPFEKPAAAVTDAGQPDPESIARLAALGYLSPASALRDSHSNEPLDDPKDCIGVYNSILRVGGVSPVHRPSAPVGRGLQIPLPPAVNAVSTSWPTSLEQRGPCAVQPSASAILLGHLPSTVEPARPTDRMPLAASR
jgi:arylsulfatase A-like enzyme